MTNTTKQEVIARIGSTLEDLGKLVLSLNAFEGEETTVATKSKSPKKVEPVKEVAEVEAGEYDYDTLNDMSLSELKELADENGVEYTKSVKKQPIIKLILDALAGEEDEEEEDEVEEDEVEIEEEEEEEIEEDEEELDTVIETEDGEVDLADLTLKQLKKFAKDNDFEVTAKDKDGIILEILESLDEEEVEEVEEDEEEEEDGEEELDLDSMSLDELKELADEEGIELPKKKKSQKAADYLEAIRELLAEELGAEEEEDEEDEEEEDEDEDEEEEEEDIATQLGLDEMDVEELAEILEDHELSTKGKKQALIARIVKAVEDGIIELDEEEGE